eukprot:6156200-Karenia_brevis.AAC.1
MAVLALIALSRSAEPVVTKAYINYGWLSLGSLYMHLHGGQSLSGRLMGPQALLALIACIYVGMSFCP